MRTDTQRYTGGVCDFRGVRSKNWHAQVYAGSRRHVQMEGVQWCAYTVLCDRTLFFQKKTEKIFAGLKCK